jgi:hypothetical protein
MAVFTFLPDRAIEIVDLSNLLVQKTFIKSGIQKFVNR